MSAERKQSGLAHDYTEWVTEEEVGVTPDDPAFRPFSDNMLSVWSGEPDASTEAQRGLGSRDPKDFFNGPEEHEFTFTYDLQQWYVDADGNTQDPAGDIMTETEDNDVRATHTVVSRELHVAGGADGGGRYIYTVGKGGYPSELTVPFETEDGLPIQQELVYRFEKVREYSISQPAADETLTVVSTSAADTTQSVTIESDGGSTTETLDLSGETGVDTTTAFGSIESAELDNQTEGDVIIGISDGAGGVDTELMRIYGRASYGGIEGDLGVPAVGAGSHAGEVGEDYVRFRSDTLLYDGTEEIAPEISSGELTIDAGIDSTGRAHTVRQSIDVGERETTLTASLAGPKPSVDQMATYLTETEHDVVWESTDGLLTLPDAHLLTPGDIVREYDSVKMIVESEWEAAGVDPVGTA